MPGTKLAHKELQGNLLTLREVCVILNCHPNTLRKWDKAGILAAIRFGTRRDRRYKKEDVIKLIENTVSK